MSNPARTVFSVIGGILILFILLMAVTGWRTVDQAETCAVLELGRLVDHAGPGFHIVKPLITNYDCFQTQQTLYQTVVDAQGDADFLDTPVEIKTSDGQTATVEFNIAFHIEPDNVEFVRSKIASNMTEVNTRVVANFGRSVPRDIAPQFTAESLYGIGRIEYERIVREELVGIFLIRGVTLDSFELRDVNFKEDYEKTINDQQIAREKIQTAQFEADAAVYKAQENVALAKGQAEATIERAKGDAESLLINARAEAESIALRGLALRDNPVVLKLEFIQNLATANWMMIPWEDMQAFLPLENMLP